jgi:hypothetical protein
MRPDIKIVIEHVAFANLTDMQKKLNQWITTGLLLKFKSHISPEGMVYEIILKKA